MKLRSGKVINETQMPEGGTLLGYKMAKDKRLVILEIPLTAKHNMERSNIVDRQLAKHRCSEAFVKEIIDLNTGASVNQANSLQKNSFTYIVGTRVFPDHWEENLESVCAGGIHYFLDRRCAEAYMQSTPLNGEYLEWSDSGRLVYKCYIKNGKTEGEVLSWHEYTGLLKSRYFCYEGKLDGEFIEWYPKGNLARRSMYKNGLRNGKETTWFNEEGKIMREITYKEQLLHGEAKVWYPNGQIKYIYNYDNGKLHGEYRSWSENGLENEVWQYVHGEKLVGSGKPI